MVFFNKVDDPCLVVFVTWTHWSMKKESLTSFLFIDMENYIDLKKNTQHLVGITRCFLTAACKYIHFLL